MGSALLQVARRASLRTGWEFRDRAAYNDTLYANSVLEAEQLAYDRILGMNAAPAPDPDSVLEPKAKPVKEILSDMERILDYHGRYSNDILLNPRGKEALCAERKAVEKILETPSILLNALSENYGERVQRLKEALIEKPSPAFHR